MTPDMEAVEAAEAWLARRGDETLHDDHPAVIIRRLLDALAQPAAPLLRTQKDHTNE